MNITDKLRRRKDNIKTKYFKQAYTQMDIQSYLLQDFRLEMTSFALTNIFATPLGGKIQSKLCKDNLTILQGKLFFTILLTPLFF